MRLWKWEEIFTIKFVWRILPLETGKRLKRKRKEEKQMKRGGVG